MTNARLDLTPLLGTWRNADQGETGGTLRLALREQDGALRLRGVGAGIPEPIASTGFAGARSNAERCGEPIDWGEIEAVAFAANATSRAAWGLTATYEFEFLRTTIFVYEKHGVLVATTYNKFRDPGGRADYFTREFFHPEGER